MLSAHTLGGILGTSRTASRPVLMDYSVTTPPPLSLLPVSTRLMAVSRLADDNLPVALARSLKPLTYLDTLKSSLVGAPPFTFKPMEKMARSGNLTFLPKRSNSLVQTTASVKMPLMAPLENGVLWLAMCSDNSSRPMVSSATARGYHLP